MLRIVHNVMPISKISLDGVAECYVHGRESILIPRSRGKVENSGQSFEQRNHQPARRWVTVELGLLASQARDDRFCSCCGVLVEVAIGPVARKPRSGGGYTGLRDDESCLTVHGCVPNLDLSWSDLDQPVLFGGDPLKVDCVPTMPRAHQDERGEGWALWCEEGLPPNPADQLHPVDDFDRESGVQATVEVDGLDLRLSILNHQWSG